MQVFDCAQGSSEWFECRRGIVTASEFSTVQAKGKTAGTVSLTRQTYMRKLAGEIVTGEVADSYSNAHMERGKVMEDEARRFYAFDRDADPLRVGFVRNGNATGSWGCSPDSLVGTDGGLEIKSALPHILIGYIEKGDFPPDHKAQVQGNIWTTEREWWDLIIYWTRMPPFIKRARRDEDYIANLAREVDRFNEELAALTERIRRYGQPSTLRADLERSLATEGGMIPSIMGG
jgi:hypothetical protein